MIPPAYIGYFTAAATAAGVLIGLLFVAISLRSETIFGPKAMPGGEPLAITAFTGLVNAFFVSILALIPHNNVGFAAVIMSVLSLISLLRLNKRLFVRRRAVTFGLTLVAYAGQLALGVVLLSRPHDSSQVDNLSYIIFFSMAVALQRAWALMRGTHIINAGQPPPVEAE